MITKRIFVVVWFLVVLGALLFEARSVKAEDQALEITDVTYKSTNMYGAPKVAGNREARIEVIVGAGHFFERSFSGYAFNEVIELATSWFDRTLKAKK